MSRWTATRLAQHTTALLRDARLILVSNRAPYSHRWHSPAPLAPGADTPLVPGTTLWDGGWLHRLSAQLSRVLQGDHTLRWSQPAGGLTAALDPVMQACHGTWVAWGSGSADRQAVDAQDHVQVPPHKPQYTLRCVWLSEAQVDGFYAGFANSALWPLCHLNLERTVFTPLHWRHYQEVNAHFATIAAEECGEKRALVWLQDYHLALCPALLRQRLPDLVIMHFWHVPWPPWELYRACPWRQELLAGLLGNDLLGFHLAQYCHNFLECAERVLGASVDYKAGVVAYEGRDTWVRPFPISIDYAWWTRLACSRRVARQIVRLRAQPDLAFPILGLGVDRLDYTKGIVHRFEAIERFLEKYPAYQGRFGFVQIAVPSRTQIEDYRQVKAQVEGAVERINTRFGVGTAKPIHYRYAHLEPAELVAYYRMADFAMVTSLHDGMNLVAKEFVASQVEQRGVLICSEFAGAAEALDAALRINPYDTEAVADTLKQAIEMSREEKAHRMARLHMHLAEHNIYKWLADIFTTLGHIQEVSDSAALAAVEAPGDGIPVLEDL
jgi:alpha,alpha-trehalose-phosphate synthase [UDP-forming]